MQSADIICKDCGKKCKSKGGYKRHRAAKHGQDENRVNSDESNTNADKTRKTFILTAVILTKIVLKEHAHKDQQHQADKITAPIVGNQDTEDHMVPP